MSIHRTYQFLLVIFILILHQTSLHAFNQIDSLMHIVENQDDDIEKVDNLLLLSKAYYKNYQMDSADIITQKALTLSEKLNYDDGKAEALYRHSLIFYRTGDYNTAIQKVNLFLTIAELLKDSVKLGKGLWLRGTLSRETNELNNARKDYLSSLYIFQSTNDTNRMLSIFQSMGNMFYDFAEYDSAAYYYHKTIECCEVVGNEMGVASALNQLGKTNAMLPIPQYNAAKEYLHKSLKINEKYGNLREIALNYSNLANIALDLDELDTAIYYYEKVKNINTKIGNKLGLIHYYNNIAEVYEKQGKYEKALDNYNISLGYYREQNIEEGIIVALQNIADIYVELFQYQLAHAYYDSAIDLAKETGYKQRLINGLANKTNAYYRETRYRDAYEYQLILNKITDSIFNLEKAEVIADLKLKYEKEKDQAQILALEKENLAKDLRIRIRTNQRNIYFLSGLGIIIVILFIAIYFRQKGAKNKIIAEQKIRQLEEEKKMFAARSLIEGQEEERKRVAKELHDGLGVLLSTAKIQFSSIKDERPENQELIEKASELIEQATGDVRKISHNMMPGLLTKFGLFEALQGLIEKIDDTKGIHASCEITGDTKRLPENTEIMLYRVIQELVNNTLKHAKAKNILLKINVLTDRLKINYSDDGSGFNVEEKIKSKSIGLQSIQSRIRFIDGTVEIKSKPGEGVEFYLQIPTS